MLKQWIPVNTKARENFRKLIVDYVDDKMEEAYDSALSHSKRTTDKYVDYSKEQTEIIATEYAEARRIADLTQKPMTYEEWYHEKIK